MVIEAQVPGTPVTEATIERLRSSFAGSLVTPESPEYEAARRVWNGAIDRRPAVIARPRGVADVIAAVRWAAEHDVLVAVRGGGHGIAGTATCDGGIVIDLSGMKGVRVDPPRRRVQAQGGLIWSELDRETQAFGLAATGGLVSSTGVGGFTLGGGIGWLQRRYGLAVDNLVGADVVTADGSLVHASADEEPELFWALRGGGGNFGVVTSFEFELHPVGPEVVAGLVFHRGEALEEVARFARSFVTRMSDDVMLVVVARTAPPAPFLPPEIHGKPVAVIAAFHAGPIERATDELGPLKSFGRPVADLVQPRRYTQFQSMLDGSWTSGAQNYWKAEYLRDLDDSAIETMRHGLDTITSPVSDFKIAVLGGAVARVAADATAYPYRDAPFIANINARWSDPADAERHVAWTRELWSRFAISSAGGAYVNFMGEEGRDRVRAAYGPATYERLVAVKRRFDPGNLFRLNQNVDPNG